VSVVRSTQSDLTTLLLSKLEEAEEVLLGKDEKSIAASIDALKDAITSPLLSTRNLTALLSEKLSKKLVLNTKDILSHRRE
jgi:predicted house-cleaning noncanonical NTP pyrophosphatase (MazG superfamily)